MSKSRTPPRSDLAPCRLSTALLTTTWLVVVDFSCCWLTWFFDFETDWSWWIESSWSTDSAPRALRPYIGHRITVISLFRTARWYSSLQVQGPRILFGLFVLDQRLPPRRHAPKTWHFFFDQGPRERPKSGAFRYFSLHTAPSVYHWSHHSLSLYNLSFFKPNFFKLSWRYCALIRWLYGSWQELFNSAHAFKEKSSPTVWLQWLLQLRFIQSVSCSHEFLLGSRCRLCPINKWLIYVAIMQVQSF